jgi:hypothetical protein
MPRTIIILLVVASILAAIIFIDRWFLTGPMREAVVLGLVAMGTILVGWVAVDVLRELIAYVRRFLSRP